MTAPVTTAAAAEEVRARESSAADLVEDALAVGGLRLAGRPFGEALVLRVGDAIQRDTDWHLRVPLIARAVSERMRGGRGTATIGGR
jgi:hypothetical protein